MGTIKHEPEKNPHPVGADFIEHILEEGWTYIKNVVDIAREPVLLLDKEFRIITANDSFYRMFQVEAKDTENKLLYELGNGQWNIPALRKLLEAVLPKNTFFSGFEVIHTFPFIGKKILILSARQIYLTGKLISKSLPGSILLAIEDITEMMLVAETFATHASQLETTFDERIKKLGTHIGKLEKEVEELKDGI